MKRVAFDLVSLVLASAHDDSATSRAHPASRSLPVVDARHVLVVRDQSRDKFLFRMPASGEQRSAGSSYAAQDYELASLHKLVSGFWFLVSGF
jgi:hypothetical protein